MTGGRLAHDQRRHHNRPAGSPCHPAAMDRHRRPDSAGGGAARWPGNGARARFGPLFFAPPLATAQRIVEMAGNGKLFTDIAATMRVSVARLCHRLRLRRRAAVPAAAVAARDRSRRALHPGLAGHSEIRADAVADPVVRHRRCAEGHRGDAVRVLHHLHHGVRRRPRRRSAAGQHGAHHRRERAHHRAQGDLDFAAAVLLHRA